ncbi:MAG: hypothetical protein Q4G09_02405 [Clostridia bacterium]|nr:hypothetical protein [Clostridia bacterium]
MRKLNKKRIAILIFIIIMIIIEILAFEFSKANNIKEIEVIVSDFDGILKDETIILQAIEDTEGGYHIILPETINEKLASKYLIESKSIQLDEQVNVQTKTEVKEQTNEQTEKQNQIQEEQPKNITAKNTITEIEANIVEKIRRRYNLFNRRRNRQKTNATSS